MADDNDLTIDDLNEGPGDGTEAEGGPGGVPGPDEDHDGDDETTGEPDGGAESPQPEDDAGQDPRQEVQRDQTNLRDGPRPNRYQTLANRLRESERARASEREEMRRELEQLRQGPQNYQRQQDQQRAREAALERARLDGPEAIAQFYAREANESFTQRQTALQIQLLDSQDQSRFEALASRNPVADRMRDRVEELLRAERARGSNPTREAIFYYELGKRAFQRLQREGTKQRQRGAAAVARETVRAPNTRSNVPSDNRRGNSSEREARAKRLSDMSI